MHHTRHLLIVFSIFAGLLMAGCDGETNQNGENGNGNGNGNQQSANTNNGGNQASQTQPGSETPRDAVERFMRSVGGGDGEAALAVVSGDDAQKQVVRALARFASQSRQFQEAFTEEYGEDTGAQFSQNGPAEQFSPENIDEALQNMEIEESEDGAATARMPDSEQNMQLRREDGRWYIDMAAEFQGAGNQQMSQTTSAFNGMADVFENNMEHIGSMSAEELSQKVGQEMMAAMTGGQPQPQPSPNGDMPNGDMPNGDTPNGPAQ